MLFSSHNPHSFLGLHESQGKQTIRVFRPGAKRIYLEVKGQIVEALKAYEDLFIYELKTKIDPSEYRIYHPNGLLAHDPYAFSSMIGDTDLFLFNEGTHVLLYEVLGAHFVTIDKVTGIRFAVWAPNASGVSVIGNFNHWDGRLCPMRCLQTSGVWELFVPGLQEGEVYKYELRTRGGDVRVKSDPFAFETELRPQTGSKTCSLDTHVWKDQSWMEKRTHRHANTPMIVYEVHIGSWGPFSSFPNYREIAIELAKYCKNMGFTHVELLPIMEHPLDESWGYQVTGFFAATSRYGSPKDFQFFVDHLHQQEIGVILDWVPAHFPTDDHALNRFDGTCLYEHEDPRKGIHPHWQTAIFNYGRKEVCNFLIASALFWLDKMHIDGLRVDAVASMLYLDYGRKDGEWVPNSEGNHLNLEAIAFLKQLNVVIHDRFPSVCMIAEESSAYPNVTPGSNEKGLGFDLKWNMGWMNDTLRYFSKDPIYRQFHQNDLTFSLLYAFSEHFLLPLSHDEVVHGKGSLLSKMPGPEWQQFAQLRLLYSYMLCHPGKKLLFMGGEFGVWKEWDVNQTLDWQLLQSPLHQGLSQMVQHLNRFYLKEGAFWQFDTSWQGYEWIDFSDHKRSCISYFRKNASSCFACIHNFNPEVHTNYCLPIANAVRCIERFNTDALCYGGSDCVNREIEIHSTHVILCISPLATMIIEVHFA